LTPGLYHELRKLAHGRLKRADALASLDTTELVHESYLRFLKAGQVGIKDQAHFLAYAARVMRSVIVDFARERAAKRHGGEDVRVSLDSEVARSVPWGEVEILRIHAALEELAEVDERMARVVEMRYFAGMSELEIARALGRTERTVRRDWEKARIVLMAALK